MCCGAMVPAGGGGGCKRCLAAAAVVCPSAAVACLRLQECWRFELLTLEIFTVSHY
jgi:hypothetical protein